ILDFQPGDISPLLLEHGLAPLPPYILKARAASRTAREEHDRRADLERYQTVYAAQEGSIAAPTAGLHFTPGLLASLKEAGVLAAELVLHVGPGTFRPILGEDVGAHRMLPERYELGPEAARAVSEARRLGRRVLAVGTTCSRTLETLAAEGIPLPAGAGETSLFIHPGHRFLCVDALITNFHLPKSTPLLLACAFAGRERLLSAYREAVEKGYRLFSYGDSMLIL
ncbi:MAG: S-adenosylmethionine:tRNA ribosyltransferase-isomerase, partial [Elusimicrobiota bacterium]